MERAAEQFNDIDLQLATELEEKNRLLDEYANEQPVEKVVQARIQQLAITKVLVKIHGRHKSLLVKAHCDLGESYLLKELFEQALYHFTVAKEINSGLFMEYEDAKQFHPFILMMIGKCCIEQQKFTEALEFLEKALQMNEQHVGKDHVSNVNIITDLAFGYTKKSSYAKALQLYSRAIAIVEKSLGPQSETLASLCLDVAKTQEALSNYQEAIKSQRRALEILKGMESADAIVLANICITLSEWCAKVKDFDNAIEAIRSSLQVYEDAYGQNDPKTCKVREKMADTLHAAGKIENAIEELKRVELAKRAIFGEMSLKVGVLYKKLVSWLKEVKKETEAKEYTDKASKILGARRNSERKQVTTEGCFDSELNDIKGSEMSEAGSAKKASRLRPNSKKGKRLIIRKTNY